MNQEEKEIDAIRKKAYKAMFYRDQDGVLFKVIGREPNFFAFRHFNTNNVFTTYYDEVSVDAKFYVLKEI
jgi:hypothetical protein